MSRGNSIVHKRQPRSATSSHLHRTAWPCAVAQKRKTGTKVPSLSHGGAIGRSYERKSSHASSATNRHNRKVKDDREQREIGGWRANALRSARRRRRREPSIRGRRCTAEGREPD